MSFAIMRMAKLKTWAQVSLSSSHTYRTRLTPNANPELLALNKTGKGTKGDVLADVKTRVSEITAKPRSNAVLAIEFLLTASPEWFKDKSQSEVNKWANANKAWLESKFGKDNLCHIVIHHDETTPHLVAYVTPEKDGKLNARGYFGTPELLSEMQTDYADAMAKFGLERGIKGSQAEHTTIRDWYGHLNQAAHQAAEKVAKVQPPAPLPDLPPWTLPGTRKEAMEAWKGTEQGERRKLVQEAAKSALEASTARQQVDRLKQVNATLSAQVQDLRKNLSAAYESLGLSKAEIAVLRKSNTSLIAHRLGYTGNVLPKENAIDFLKRAADFDYGQAIAWLHAEFGPVVTGAFVSNASQQANEIRPFTKTEKAIKRAVDAQLDAVNAEKYRITLISYDENQKSFVPGKGKTKTDPEHFYSRDEIIEMIPFMRYQNNQGMTVSITPIDDNAHYLVVDDSKLSKDELTKAGFEPCLFMATSWNSHQAVLKVPKDLDRDAVLAVCQQLNKVHGDPDMQALKQPFRLAGFRNIKPKHLKDGLYPFVKLLSSVNTFCHHCIEMIKKVELSTYPQLQQHNKNIVPLTEELRF